MPTTNPALYRLERNLTYEQLIDELAAMPGRLRTMLSGRAAAAVERRAAPGEWTPLETCRHVRDVVQVYGMRFKWMILQDDPFLADYDENRWAASSPDGAADIESILDEIAAYRGETVRLLRSLSPDGWQRRGRHEVLGSVELDTYVRHELAHEEQHLAQLLGSLAEIPQKR
jgi:hypothetical protein